MERTEAIEHARSCLEMVAPFPWTLDPDQTFFEEGWWYVPIAVPLPWIEEAITAAQWRAKGKRVCLAPAPPGETAILSPDDPVFQGFVEHPHYGRLPRRTNWLMEHPNPVPVGFERSWPPYRMLTWFPVGEFVYRPGGIRVAGTGIDANLENQGVDATSCFTQPTVHVYFDEAHRCRMCNRGYLFFAEEQKFLFEDLKILPRYWPPGCPICRVSRRRLRRAKKRYDELLSGGIDTQGQAEEVCVLLDQLVEGGVFPPSALERSSYLKKKFDIRG